MINSSILRGFPLMDPLVVCGPSVGLHAAACVRAIVEPCNMRQDCLDLLPDHCKRVVSEAEIRACQPIGLLPYTDLIKALAPEAVAAGLPLLIMDNSAAEIQVSENGLSVRELAHEILHVERNWLIPVWRMAPREKEAPIGKLLLSWENEIEHLSILPKERALLPEGFETFWETRLQDGFEGATQPDAHPILKSVNLQRIWMSLELVGLDGGLKQRCTTALDEVGARSQAIQLAAAMAQARGEKLEQCLAFMRHFRIPPEDLQFERFRIGQPDHDVLMPEDI